MRSDAYALRDDARLVAVDPEANRRRVIELDARFYRNVGDLDARFPHGPPSLAQARRLAIEGDHRFGSEGVVRGDVTLAAASEAPVEIANGSVLEGEG